METADRRAKMACPLNGKMCINGVREDFPADEVGLKATCRWWTHLRGKHPQDFREIDQYDCAVAWMPVTIIEASQHARQTSHEVHNVLNGMAAVLPTDARQRFIEATGPVTELPRNGNPALINKNGEAK